MTLSVAPRLNFKKKRRKCFVNFSYEMSLEIYLDSSSHAAADFMMMRPYRKMFNVYREI